VENKPGATEESLAFGALVGRVLENTEKLVRLELALIRSELRQDISSLSRRSLVLAGAGVGLFVAFTLFSFGIAALVVERTGWSWSGALLGLSLCYLTFFGLVALYIQLGLSGASLYPGKSFSFLKEAFQWKTLSKQN
jgi:hypothetical protein